MRASRDGARFTAGIALGMVWLGAALVVMGMGLQLRVGFPIIPVLIFTPTLALIWAFKRSASFRAWSLALPLPGLVLYHALRAPIGFHFLQLAERGELDTFFAKPAGYGDIIAGGAAVCVALACGRATTSGQRLLLWLWNGFGLLDIVIVVISAQYVFFFGGGAAALGPLATLPLGVVPIAIVPGVFLTHFLIFRRLAHAK